MIQWVYHKFWELTSPYTYISWCRTMQVREYLLLDAHCVCCGCEWRPLPSESEVSGFARTGKTCVCVPSLLLSTSLDHVSSISNFRLSICRSSVLFSILHFFLPPHFSSIGSGGDRLGVDIFGPYACQRHKLMFWTYGCHCSAVLVTTCCQLSLYRRLRQRSLCHKKCQDLQWQE